LGPLGIKDKLGSMRKKPTIFTSLQSQAVPVPDDILSALERDLDESLLRNLVRLILAEEFKLNDLNLYNLVIK